MAERSQIAADYQGAALTLQVAEQKELLLAVLAHSLAAVRDEVIEAFEQKVAALEQKVATLADELGALRAEQTLAEAHKTEVVDLPALPFVISQRWLGCPFGGNEANGFLHANDTYQTAGEPLIAVSGVPDDIARNCRDSAANTKVVFANGPQSFARDLQAYDEVVAKQKLILVASPTDMDHIQPLRDRGCTVWRMAPEEILLGEPDPRRRLRSSLVGRTIRAADIALRTVVWAVDCADNEIEGVAQALETATAALEENEPPAELEDAIARLFSVLFECSECCFGAHDSWAVVGRTVRTSTALAAGLRKHDLAPTVTAISSLTPEAEYDGIVLAGWPNDARFRRLLDLEAAPDIRVLIECSFEAAMKGTY